jgi:hypothetical protein
LIEFLRGCHLENELDQRVSDAGTAYSVQPKKNLAKDCEENDAWEIVTTEEAIHQQSFPESGLVQTTSFGQTDGTRDSSQTTFNIQSGILA